MPRILGGLAVLLTATIPCINSSLLPRHDQPNDYPDQPSTPAYGGYSSPTPDQYASRPPVYPQSLAYPPVPISSPSHIYPPAPYPESSSEKPGYGYQPHQPSSAQGYEESSAKPYYASSTPSHEKPTERPGYGYQPYQSSSSLQGYEKSSSSSRAGYTIVTPTTTPKPYPTPSSMKPYSQLSSCLLYLTTTSLVTVTQAGAQGAAPSSTSFSSALEALPPCAKQAISGTVASCGNADSMCVCGKQDAVDRTLPLACLNPKDLAEAKPFLRSYCQNAAREQVPYDVTTSVSVVTITTGTSTGPCTTTTTTKVPYIPSTTVAPVTSDVVNVSTSVLTRTRTRTLPVNVTTATVPLVTSVPGSGGPIPIPILTSVTIKFPNSTFTVVPAAVSSPVTITTTGPGGVPVTLTTNTVVPVQTSGGVLVGPNGTPIAGPNGSPVAPNGTPVAPAGSANPSNTIVSPIGTGAAVAGFEVPGMGMGLVAAGMGLMGFAFAEL